MIDFLALVVVVVALLPAFARTLRGVGLLSLVYLVTLVVCVPLARRAVSATYQATFAAGIGAMMAGAVSLVVFVLAAGIRTFVLSRRAKQAAAKAP